MEYALNMHLLSARQPLVFAGSWDDACKNVPLYRYI